MGRCHACTQPSLELPAPPQGGRVEVRYPDADQEALLFDPVPAGRVQLVALDDQERETIVECVANSSIRRSVAPAARWSSCACASSPRG